MEADKKYCLAQAVIARTTEDKPEDIVKRAEAFRVFLDGKSTDETPEKTRG